MAGKIIITIAWAGVIFIISSIPSLKSPFDIWDIYLRKAAHITEYFILMVLVVMNFKKNNEKARIISFLIAGLYAVGDEFHQKFVPGRVMALSDMVWDWIGCSIGYIYMGYIYDKNSIFNIKKYFNKND
ncbi:MAG: VanZ family protein [Elusimicrobiota bacterium]